MRRGHPAVGGWRSENQRHFRAGGSGGPHFRPHRPPSLMEPLRYPPPGPRPLRPSYHQHSNEDHDSNYDRHRYRYNSWSKHRPQEKPHQSQPFSRRNEHAKSYKDQPNYYRHKSDDNINNMGDIDHRQTFQRRISGWATTPNDNRQNFEKKVNPPRQQRYSEGEAGSMAEYAGHRPPALDHYGNPVSIIDESDAFSRSVDDTVDIVRKRLMNRDDPTITSDHPMDVDERKIKSLNEPTTSNYIKLQEQPTKKKIQTQQQSEKIKSKIVNQLFKMDKDKIHKLMDNPSSSDKFEYALSSLITESQNSYHRHMRSLAEKSLCGSEFIQNDNNTIYEDTFMKQMQCILDPQDTVLLEDMKPMVLAELSKVLQLDGLNPGISYEEQYPPEYYDNFPKTEMFHDDDKGDYFDQEHSINDTNRQNMSIENQLEYFANDSTELQQSRNEIDSKDFNKEVNSNLINVTNLKPVKQWRDNSTVQNETLSLSDRIEQLRRQSYESRRLARLSSDKPNEEVFNQSDKQIPLFDGNAGNNSEEDDPFADLDNQYHVAVDPNFIEPDDIGIPKNVPQPPIPEELSQNIVSPEKRISIKKEIENQFQTFVNSPIKLGCKDKKTKSMHLYNHELNIKKEKDVPIEKPHNISQSSKPSGAREKSAMFEPSIENSPSQMDLERSEKSTLNTIKSSLLSNARKRSTDQRPAHRKEKRKKSESGESDSNKQILNKNIIINVTDCASGTKEKVCDKTAKSIFNLYFSKEDSNKECKEPKKSDTSEKTYSDKYVKRKETQKKIKEPENENKKKNNSSSSSHSNISPKDTSKSDGKIKLHTFDMFSEQPKKSNVYHGHRNTSMPANDTTPTKENKCKPAVKHISTQFSKKVSNKQTQTIRKRLVMRASQTDPVTIQTTAEKTTDPFERMKEIDLEIQVLLQEKFKLYNSIESNSSSLKSMENLGMTVVNVPMEKNDASDTVASDTVVEEFTNIPVAELEEIALESMKYEDTEMAKTEKQSPNQCELANKQDSSESQSVKRSKRKKAFNISLLEQIIDDERPLEDIISLDDLEASPVKAKVKVVKTKKKPIKKATKKKVAKKSKQIECDYVETELEHYEILKCSVILEKIDVSKYLTPDVYVEETADVDVIEVTDNLISNTIQTSAAEVTVVSSPEASLHMAADVPSTCSIVEGVLNDIQFDMLDVSEDIVIGEGYERDESLKGEGKLDYVGIDEVVLDNCLSSGSFAQSELTSSDAQYKVYDFSTDENLKRDSKLVSGNADAVLAIECAGNNFVAACLDGNVYHFTSDGTLLSTLRGSNLAVTCLTLVKEKYGTTIYTGSLDSRIRYYDLETGLEKGPECNVLSPIQSMDRAWDTIFVGTRTGFVLQFECKNNMLIPVSTVKFSDQTIVALRAMKEGPRKVLLVGARSENVTIKDALSGLLLRTLEGPKMTVYTLLYIEGKVYCGTSSQHIQVYDYTSGQHVGSLVGGKGAVVVVSAGGLVFAGCYDGAVYAFRPAERTPLALFRGPNTLLLSLAVHDTKIIAGYKDRSLYIWKIPLNVLKEMIL